MVTNPRIRLTDAAGNEIKVFELLDSPTRLASSESALLNAYVTYQEAYINYQRATWTLLDGMGMIVETPKAR